MKLEYSDNPLETKVLLTDDEQEKLRKQIQKDCEEEDEYRSNLGVEPLQAQKIFKACIEALLGSHHGDCICAPSTCLKCYAEDFLGISTLPSKDSFTNFAIHRGFQVHKTAELCLKNITLKGAHAAIEKHALTVVEANADKKR
jgi:hypothetical protein